MRRRLTQVLAATALAMLVAGTAAADGDYRISGPATHANLAVYFIHGRSAPGPVPLTLQEALAKKTVRVSETGDVNSLRIENRGDDDVFVQSGSIVKGGQQDRVLTVSLLLPAHSGQIPIDVFCVEHGRWSARGNEDRATFATADAVVPSKAVKNAIGDLSSKGGTAAGVANASQGQAKVWNEVSKIQANLSKNLGTSVSAPQSESSLKLSLENATLKRSEGEYVKALQGAGTGEDDIVGYAFAVNGELNSAEVYPSNALFRKMWPSLLASSAAEAVSEKTARPVAATPAPAAVQQMLDSDAAAPAAVAEPGKDMKVLTRETASMRSFEAVAPKGGAWINKSYLAK